MALYYRYRAVVYMACGSAVVWKIWAYRGELVRYYRLPRGTTAVDFYRGGPTLSHVKLKHACVASRSSEQPILKVAIGSGSGASLLKNVKADLYLVGKNSHRVSTWRRSQGVQCHLKRSFQFRKRISAPMD